MFVDAQIAGLWLCGIKQAMGLFLLALVIDFNQSFS